MPVKSLQTLIAQLRRGGNSGETAALDRFVRTLVHELNGSLATVEIELTVLEEACHRMRADRSGEALGPHAERVEVAQQTLAMVFEELRELGLALSAQRLSMELRE